jgi:GLPGLI family protein
LIFRGRDELTLINIKARCVNLYPDEGTVALKKQQDMKKIWITGAVLLAGSALVQAQQTAGKIVYERTVEMRISFGGMSDEVTRNIPRTRTDKIEVSFANNQSVRKTLPPDETDEQAFNGTVNGGGGMVIRTMSAGADDILFTDLVNNTFVEQREFGAKKYIIADSVRKLSWKLTGETKTILGYACQQAIATRIATRQQMTMVNGEMKSDPVTDTSVISAWIAPSIPVAAGPEMQGQLPGLMLALDINNGRTVYRAVELSPKVDIATIKEPKTGKKVTPKEFEKERDEVMKNMQRNNGGRTMIRVGG